MNPRASISIPLEDYQRETSGAPFGVVVLTACVAFAAGLVIGMSNSNDGDRPAPRPTPAVEMSVPGPRTAPPLVVA